MTIGNVQSGTASDLALIDWRHKASNVLLAVKALILLPMVTLFSLGFGSITVWPLKIIVLLTYVVVLYGALTRRIDYRLRVWLIVGMGYLCSLIGTIVVPQGPYVRALPIVLAIVVLVLLGSRSARYATLLSAGLILIGPLLSTIPWLVHLFVHRATATHTLPGNSVFQILCMLTMLIGTMLLLEGFHHVLLQSLTLQQRATEALTRESAERAAALRTIELEIEERRRLERELAHVTDEERRSLGQDVHDGVCQQLTGALLRCQALERRLARHEELRPTELQTLSQLLEEAINEAYDVAQGLYPLEPEPGALAHALHVLAKRTQTSTALRCRFVAVGETDVPDPALAQHAYRIVQEAISNVVRHAGAAQLTVSLHGKEHELILQVEDDGSGLHDKQTSGGMGMRTMACRAQSMGGTLSVDNIPTGGLRVTCRIPRPPTDRSIAMVEGVDDACGTVAGAPVAG